MCGELLKQKSFSVTPFDLYHFRDGDYEVDFVIERPDGSIVGIEVKASRSIHSEDLRGLQHLKRLAKKSFKRGIVLHSGTKMEYLGDGFWSLPFQSMWA